MSDTSTTRLIKVYEQTQGRPRFFSSLFQSPPRNFHDTEKIEIDVIRSGQHIAVPVKNLNSGPRDVELDEYVNKAFTPAVFKLRTTVNAADLIKRTPGVDPFTDPDFGANATDRAFRAVRKLENMIRDGIELMAAQVMQTGTLTVTDENGASVYALDFQPLDATGTLASGDLIVTTGTAWAVDGSTGTPMSDIDTLADNMAARGYDATDLAFGASAWQRFLGNATVLGRYNLLNANFGALGPPTQAPPGGGPSPMGSMTIGARLYRLWLYNATYRHPQTAAVTRYLATDKVVMWASDAPRDLSWGGVPIIEAARDPRAMAFLPARMSMGAAGMDLHLGAYFTQDAQSLVVTVDSRPLTIPTAIDSIACIDVAP